MADEYEVMLDTHGPTEHYDGYWPGQGYCHCAQCTPQSKEIDMIINVSPLDVIVSKMPTSGLFYVEAFTDNRTCYKHEAFFDAEEDAYKLMARVITRGSINTNHWIEETQTCG